MLSACTLAEQVVPRDAPMEAGVNWGLYVCLWQCVHECASSRAGVSVPEQLHPQVCSCKCAQGQGCACTRVSPCLRCHSVMMLQQTCAWARNWQRIVACACVCMHMWHIYRHRHGVHAGIGICVCLGPCMEGWHSWGAMWGLGWQGDICVLLCNAEPQVPLMPVAPPTPPMLPVTPRPQAYSENMGQAMSRSALCKARWKVMPSSS